MSNVKEVRIEAKTVEAAVVMACVKLGVTQDNIEFEVLKQPKSGLMSIFGGKAEIKAWSRSGEGRQGAHKGGRNNNRSRNDSAGGNGRHHDMRDARGGQDKGGPHSGGARNQERGPKNNRGRNNNDRSDRARRPEYSDRKPREFVAREDRPPAEPLTAEALSQLEIEIRDFCKELCERISGESVNVTSVMTPEKLQLEVDNTSIAKMIQEQEKFIESLEHILRKKPRHLKQDLPFRIFVDAQGSRKGREQDIAKFASEQADLVASTGQKIVLDYKSAADRKVVHMTLENDQRVYTKSIGSGSGRKLMILPSRGQRPAQDSQENFEDDTSNS